MLQRKRTFSANSLVASFARHSITLRSRSPALVMASRRSTRSSTKAASLSISVPVSAPEAQSKVLHRPKNPETARNPKTSSATCSSPAPVSTDLPTLLFADATIFETWLAAQMPGSPGLWTKISKKASGIPSVNYDQALDVALCHGWIDGQRRSLDANYFLQRFTPRRKNSKWSKRNVDKIVALTNSGRMRPGGQKEVDAAREDGRWERAYSSPSNIQPSADFLAALDKSEDAKTAYEALSKMQRYGMLLRVEFANREETKTRLIEQFVATLAEGEVP